MRPDPPVAAYVPLTRLIPERLDSILEEFEAFARTMVPPATTMSPLGLRNHAGDILLAIVKDMETAQTAAERHEKSRGQAPLQAIETAAAAHGALRHLVGFDLKQLVAEFRALRASVLRRWMEEGSVGGTLAVEEVSRFNEGIDQALAESVAAYAGRLAESRDLFLAVLGHDLRSPLGALSGCLQLMSTPSAAPDAKERAQSIAHRSVDVIDRMVTDLLEYTRTRLGRGIEITASFDALDSLCQEVVDEARAAHPGRAVIATFDGDLRCSFDRARMRQVLTNLVGNAIHHGDPLHEVTLRANRAENWIQVSIHNMGEPIPEDSLQVIFNPLVQVTRGKTAPSERPKTSLGLGLFIAQQIVRAHDGELSVVSSAGQGTTFSVRLPAPPATTSADG